MSNLKKFFFLILFSYTNIAFSLDDKEDCGSVPHLQQFPKSVEISENADFSSRSNKRQIQQNPPLWLHIKVEKSSLYAAYANAWVTLGEQESAKRYAVESISLSLRFEKETEKKEVNSATIEVSERTSKKNQREAYAFASTTGPIGHISVATN